IIGTGISSNLPHDYGAVAAMTVDTANSFTWIFNDPTDANFTFRGHIDGTIQSGMCSIDQKACATNAECCSGLCAGTCCEAPQSNCTSAADCCGSSSCNGSKCCHNTGAACAADADCCSGSCGTLNTCN